MVSSVVDVLEEGMCWGGGPITGGKCGGITGRKTCRKHYPRNGSSRVGHPVFSPTFPFLQQLFPQNYGWKPPYEGTECQ